MKSIQILVADGHSKNTVEIIKARGWGRMVSTQTIKPYPNEPWGFDNGAWACYVNKTQFNTELFQKRMKAMEKFGSPIMAVTPDIVTAGMKSLNFSNNWIGKLDNGWPWFLAVQDGMDKESVEKSITHYPYAGIFLGGEDDFKAHTAKQWVNLAHGYGLKFHWGRCGTPIKIKKALKLGADSCDSSFPHWIKSRLAVVDRAIQAHTDLVNYRPLEYCIQ